MTPVDKETLDFYELVERVLEGLPPAPRWSAFEPLSLQDSLNVSFTSLKYNDPYGRKVQGL